MQPCKLWPQWCKVCLQSKSRAIFTKGLLVMYNHGYSLDNLKAAFPLLAACEFDLARLSRNACDNKGYNDHLDNAKSWLQMTYGEDSPMLKLALQDAFSLQTTPQPSFLLMGRKADLEETRSDKQG